VASKLVVSIKTVEFHLANVFTKLGLRSRSQLSAALEQSSPGD
jgi:Response regulator containing a CheY-like receiver domain and an HTH DNA-binding domain